jgi:ATP-binding cassette, subfamily B, bacterial
VLPALAYLGISIFVMFSLDWRLSLVVLAFTPIPALIGYFAAKEQTRRERTLLERWMKIYARFNEVLSGIMTVKSFTMEEAEKRRFLVDVDDANDVVVRGVWTDSSIGAVKNGVTMFARIAVIAMGSWLILAGQVTVGTLVAFLGYVGGLFGPVQGLTNIYQTLRKAGVALDTIFGILDAQDTLEDMPGAKSLRNVEGSFHFRDVTFAYPDSDPVIHNVTIEAKKGEVVALVGPSGGGKSTLMALAQRLYDPDSGAVCVDGVDIRTVTQKSLRENIGIVLQETLLFNDTVRNNICYGRPGASQKDVERVARAANAHDFLMDLPDGYDTVVGERGTRFSTGQRQRIAIARALLKDPPILILDEATSALDVESEARVQQSLEVLMRGRTTFVIAHRLSTIVGADRIVVLRDGRITERGPHAELMARKGYYASLVERQTRGLVGVRGLVGAEDAA